MRGSASRSMDSCGCCCVEARQVRRQDHRAEAFGRADAHQAREARRRARALRAPRPARRPSMASTCGCRWRPASVRRWPPASRENRAVPICFSSAWMRRATVVCSTASRRAAPAACRSGPAPESSAGCPSPCRLLVRSPRRALMCKYAKPKCMFVYCHGKFAKIRCMLQGQAAGSPALPRVCFFQETTPWTPPPPSDRQGRHRQAADRRQVRRVARPPSGATSSTRPRRRCWRACPSPRRPRSMPPWPRRKEAFKTWKQDAHRRARPHLPEVPAADPREHGRAGRHPHGRAGQDPARRRGRRVPRPRSGRARGRHRQPAAGRAGQQRGQRRRHLHAAAAAGRVRRHHAVQLPGDDPAVDVPDGDRHAATPSC